MSFSLEQLSDLEAIRNVALRYCRGVDRLDVEVMKSAYWPEATDEHGAFKGNAWDFCEYCMTAHDGWRSTNHRIFNHAIDLDANGKSARGELYNVTHLFRRDEPVLDTWHGRYLDRYEKRDGEWRIIERVCVHEGTESVPTTAMAIDATAYRQGDFDRGTPGRPIGP